MYKLQCRTEWKRCASPRRWALASGLFIISSVGIAFAAAGLFRIVGAAMLGCWIILQARRFVIHRRFASLFSGNDLIAGWIVSGNGPALFSRRGVYYGGTFVCWRQSPAPGLKRAEFNRHTGIFKFVITSDDVFRPWARRHYYLKVNVPEDAFDAADAAEKYFAAFAAHHRRKSLVESPNASETDLNPL